MRDNKEMPKNFDIKSCKKRPTVDISVNGKITLTGTYILNCLRMRSSGVSF